MDELTKNIDEAMNYYQSAQEEFQHGHYHQVVGNLMYAQYILEKTEQPDLLCKVYLLMCRTFIQLKNFEKAHDYSEKGLDISSGRNVYDECEFWNIDGVIFSNEGKPAKAVACYRQTASLLTGDTSEIGARLQIAALCNSGNCHLHTPDYPKASESYLKALKLFRYYDDKVIKGRVLLGLGYVYYFMDNLDFAERCFNAARKYITVENDSVSYGRLMHNLGEVYMKRGQLQKARTFYNDSLENENVNRLDKSRTVSSLFGLASTYINSDNEHVKKFCISALSRAMEGITSRFSKREEKDVGRVFFLLAECLHKENNLAECRIYLHQAESIFKKYNLQEDLQKLNQFKQNLAEEVKQV